MPSGEVAAELDEADTATNRPLPKATLAQLPDGSVLCVHVMPSVDVAATVDVVVVVATKTPLPKATATQFAATGKVLAVHVMPSGEDAAAVLVLVDTATKMPFP